MATIREQIITAVIAHLGSVSRPAEIPEPVRTRVESPKPSQLPVVTVYPAQEIVDPMRDEKAGRSSRGAVVRRALDLKFEVVTKATAGAATTADAAADPILVWISDAMSSIGKVVPVGETVALCNDPPDEIGTAFEYEQSEYLLCRATLTYRFFYQSSSIDVEAIA